MKKSPPKPSAAELKKPKKAPPEKRSAAAQVLGGQPENDEDARAAGFESATATAGAGKPRKTRSGGRGGPALP